MIPEIGVMVELYVVTRMLRLVTDELTAGRVMVFGVITALVAAVVMADVSSSQPSRCPGNAVRRIG